METVITGVGCISALGIGYDEFCEKLVSGATGFRPIQAFDASQCLTRVAAEVPDYDESAHFEPARISGLDRFSQFALIASREAVKDSGLDFSGEVGDRTAVVQGTGSGGQITLDTGYQRLYRNNATKLHPLTVPRLMPSAAVSQVSLELGIRGPVYATTSACSSAAHAILTGAMLIRQGLAEVVVTGGSEACVNYGSWKGWEGLRVMATDACRPFSKGRTGMIIGEGAGALVLESLEHAKRRGARIRAHLVGFGMSSDAHHIVHPQPTGAIRAMTLALKNSALTSEQIDYVNAHGTGTVQNDVCESVAIQEVFGSRAAKLPVSSTKSQVGHLLGASGAIEAIATICALERQMAPPTMNFEEPDPECPLDVVPNEARSAKIRGALSNSFAFGGLNVSLVFRSATSV